ncbi:MAG: AMP-binding protein, partial [Nonomuraea sp.]|nr:AMP-binding protein [Nonomuraea sp.]
MTGLTVADLVRRAHARYGGHPAIRTEDGPLSFAELGALVDRLAAGLAALGCRPGDRVVLALENRPELLALEQAVWVSGLVRVALSSRSHPQEIAHVARDCEAAVVVCEDAHAAALDGLPGLVPLAGYPRLLKYGEPAVRHAPQPDDVAALLYTSGTTGRPKGAVVTHRSWVAMVEEFAAQLPPMGPGDLVLHTAPISHFGGSVGSACLLRGAAAMPVRRFDPRATLDLVQRHGVTVLPLVPTMLKELTAVAAGYDLSSLRAIPYGGSAIGAVAAGKAHAAFGEILYQFYGLSEALAPVAVLSARDHLVRPESAGRFCPGVAYRVVVGVLQLSGDCVMRGYWNDPEQTAEVLRDGWFSTGDLGFVDDQGFLHLVDRSKEVIISGGFNVYPAEVERVIETLDGVREVA